MCKSTIDAHFNSNYDQYLSMCNWYYKRRYIAQDMLHELYFKLLSKPAATVESYAKEGKLHVLGIYALRELFRSRKVVKQRSDVSTSPLFESANYDPNLHRLEVLQVDQVSQKEVEAIEAYIDQQLLAGNKDMRVLVESIRTPIYKLSKETGIDHRKLYKSRENALNQLKQIA